ncbi:MAG: integrase arm-type DNA-binding domain-containing protein [Methylotenera sp.]|nr:integrase arm-type DNA-binding domain-containing protein [Methylotenera sp.]
MLTDTKIRAAKGQDKDYKLADEKSLYLLIKPNDSKLWRMNYRFEGSQKSLALGKYPEISLLHARERRDSARKQLADGTDPGLAKKAAKEGRDDELSNSFEVVARDWHQSYMKNKAQSHANKVIRRFEEYVFPYIGKKPLIDISPPDIIQVVKRIEKLNLLETAHRTLQTIGQVFRYGVQTGKIDRSPAIDLKGLLPARNVKHFAAFTEPNQVADFLRSLDALSGGVTVQNAVRLAPLLFCRPSELRKMRWSELDLEKSQWQYFVGKVKKDHLVPLSKQAIEIIRELFPISGNLTYVFKGGRDPQRPMSESAVNAALKRLGYDTQNEITGHGFRAMARTILHERLNIDPHVIEHQLSHAVPDALGTAYNRTKFIDQRTKMMQIWADYLDELKAGAKVIPFIKNA